MGSLLSHVIANFFMEDFKEMALSRVAYKHHEPKELKNFLNHLNDVHPTCSSPWRLSPTASHLPFLDIDMYRRPDGSSEHTV